MMVSWLCSSEIHKSLKYLDQYEKQYIKKSKHFGLWTGDSYPKVKPRRPAGSRVAAYKSRQCFFISPTCLILFVVLEMKLMI